MHKYACISHLPMGHLRANNAPRSLAWFKRPEWNRAGKYSCWSHTVAPRWLQAPESRLESILQIKRSHQGPHTECCCRCELARQQQYAYGPYHCLHQDSELSARTRQRGRSITYHLVLYSDPATSMTLVSRFCHMSSVRSTVLSPKYE